MIAAAVGAVVAEMCTLPVDLLKVRMQLYISPTRQIPSMRSILRQVLKEEGVQALWKGAIPSLVRQVALSSSCMLLYEPLRDAFRPEGTSTPRFQDKLLAGGLSGALGSALLNPIEVVKVRMQAGSGQRYPTMRSGLLQVWTKEGMAGLYRGALPNVQRAFIVCAAELGTYDQVKELLAPLLPFGSPLTHAVASVAAGGMGALCSNPIDIVKTRLMQEGPSSSNPFLAQWKCASSIVRHEGAISLFNGVMPTWLRKGPWCLLFFLVYEKTLIVMRRPSS